MLCIHAQGDVGLPGLPGLEGRAGESGPMGLIVRLSLILTFYILLIVNC